ncbi:MAG: aspartate kinase, partial [Anaerolineae bacterium]|nr:aspartate kinase [Anaerolineae bacterium]
TMKFGGTSVGSSEAIDRVVNIIEETVQSGKQVAVVVSAMSGVTDMLLQSVQNAVEGNRWGYLSLSKDIRFKHEDVVHQHLKPGAQREEILRTIDAMLKELEEICQAIQILQEATPRIYDAVVSFGERLSSRVIAAVLQERGLRAQAYDAGQFLVTDDRHRDAEPLWDLTQERIGDHLRPVVEEQGIIPILTGFLGATKEGHITTLGRGGSDYSAAIFAAYLNAEELIIWTDVDGVMTTDPRVDPRARVLDRVSYTEVGELAFYGAKVLHPKTVQPIVSKNIPMRVRNTFNLDAPGTLINGSMEPSPTVIKAVTSVRNVSMLTVSGRGMLGVPGIAGRTFLATAHAGASILMISQSSSEQSFCFTVVDDRAPYVKHAVETELSAEIERRDVDSIDVMSNVVIITAVGAGMRHQPGVAGRVFTTMGDHGVNVLAIAQGSSECSISFLVAEKDLEHAVIHLHDLALG